MARPVTETRPLYARVTDAIVADLERGVRPWTKPWATGAGGAIGRPLRHSGEPYRAINVLLLWSEAFEHGYDSATWMTFRQALALGGHVRKGEHGAMVVYANRIVREDADAPEDGVRTIPFLKAYTVFNVGQIDGLPEAYASVSKPEVSADRRIAAVEAFVDATGATVRHGGDQAYYAPGPGPPQIQVPEHPGDAGHDDRDDGQAADHVRIEDRDDVLNEGPDVAAGRAAGLGEGRAGRGAERQDRKGQGRRGSSQGERSQG
jgi:antirestriction protein ArdC